MSPALTTSAVNRGTTNYKCKARRVAGILHPLQSNDVVEADTFLRAVVGLKPTHSPGGRSSRCSHPATPFLGPHQHSSFLRNRGFSRAGLCFNPQFSAARTR